MSNRNLQTLREWYDASGTSAFYKAIRELFVEDIERLLEADLTRPPTGKARTLASITEANRTEVPPIEELRSGTSELNLQRLFMHRGYLKDEDEPVLAREISSSL